MTVGALLSSLVWWLARLLDAAFAVFLRRWGLA